MDPVSSLVPHRGPFLLVDRVDSVEAGVAVVARKLVTAGDALLGDRGLGGPLLVEALAQASACLMGSQRGGGGHLGYLVAAQGFRFHGEAGPGEIVTLRARRVSALGLLHRFECAASVGDRPLCEGTLTFALQAAPLDGPAAGR